MGFKIVLSTIKLLLRVYLIGIPKQDKHIKDILWLIHRHRAGYEKYRMSLKEYREKYPIKNNIDEVEKRIKNYKNDGEKKHLIDACFYLSHEKRR